MSGEISEVERLKTEANALFKSKDYLKAAAAYSRAIKQHGSGDSAGLAVLYSNRSASLLKLNKVSKAREDADECIRLNPSWEKGHFRKGQVQEILGEFSGAYDSYVKASQVSPDNKDLETKVALMAKKSGKPPKPKPLPPAPTPPLHLISSTSKDEEASMWGDLESSSTRDFVEEHIAILVAESRENGRGSLVPLIHFEIGLERPTEEQENSSHIRAAQAFRGPETLLDFVEYLRNQAQLLKATSVLLLAPKSSIEFPPVWTREGWPAGDEGGADGVICQLESNAGGKKVRRVCFFPFSVRSSMDDGRTLGKPLTLDSEMFSLLPTLLV